MGGHPIQSASVCPHPALSSSVMSEDASAAVLLRDEGNAFFKAKEYMKAVACYKKATTKDPTCYKSFANLAAALLAVNKFSQALAAAESCVAVSPDFVKG